MRKSEYHPVLERKKKVLRQHKDTFSDKIKSAGRVRVRGWVRVRLKVNAQATFSVVSWLGLNSYIHITHNQRPQCPLVNRCTLLSIWSSGGWVITQTVHLVRFKYHRSVMSIRCCYSWTPQFVKVWVGGGGGGGLLAEGVGRGLSVWLCSFYHCETDTSFTRCPSTRPEEPRGDGRTRPK